MAVSDTTRITSLTAEKVAMSYTLVKTAIPTVSIEEWQEYAESYISEPPEKQGIIAIEDDRGYLFGLFTYHTRHKLSEGRILVVENLVAADLYGREIILDKLMDALSLLQRKLNCISCRTIFDGQFNLPCELEKSLAKSLEKRGFVPTSVSVERRICHHAQDLESPFQDAEICNFTSETVS